MEINKHISFLKQENPELLAYLNENCITYKAVLHSCVFDIYESDPHWDSVRALMEKKGAHCISNTIYNNDELSTAQWLTMRSLWKNGYPQPEDGGGYEAVTYDIHNICTNCGTGMRQIAEFRIKNVPKWGKRHFMMLNWVGDELFVDDIAKRMLEMSELTGFSFRQVSDKKGLEMLTNVSQIVVKTVLPEGLIIHNRAIDKVNQCPNCRRIKYHSTGIGSLEFRGEIFRNAPDIVKTSELFGWEYWTQRELLVSQQFYQFVIKNHLGTALDFAPVKLI